MNIVIGIMFLLACFVVFDWIKEVYESELENKIWIAIFLGIQIVEFVMRAIMEFAK